MHPTHLAMCNGAQRAPTATTQRPNPALAISLERSSFLLSGTRDNAQNEQNYPQPNSPIRHEVFYQAPRIDGPSSEDSTRAEDGNPEDRRLGDFEGGRG